MNSTIGGMVLMAGSVLLAAGTVLAQPDGAAGTATGRAGSNGAVTVRFWGQACFTITADGKTLLTDPYSPKVGYKPFAVKPDLVVISHEHFDHNDTDWLEGKPVILHGLGSDGQVQHIDRQVGPFHVRTVPARHWENPDQAQRGNDAIFVVEVAGLKIVHLGDLGRKLTAKQVKEIGRPDVLMIPVGGFFTIDADQAYSVVEQLKPRIYVIPMHYRTPALEAALKSRLAEPTAFLRKFGEDVKRVAGNTLTVRPGQQPGKVKAVLLGYVPDVSR